MPDKQALSAITVFNKSTTAVPTQDEIMQMAREAGAPGWWSGETDSNVPGRYWLSRFAALVAQRESRGSGRVGPLPLLGAPAQAAPAQAGPSEAVAYLDIGIGGYLDLGTDLADEALSRLPKGRHALVIAGTYGIDGYTAASTPQAAPAGVLEDAARWHWMAEYIVGTRTELDDELIASATVDELSKLVDADLAARGAAPAQPRDDAVFVVWWSDHMPNSTEADAWAEWCALRSNQPAAQAQEDAKDAALWRALQSIPKVDKLLWQYVLSDEMRDGHDSVEQALVAITSQQGEAV